MMYAIVEEEIMRNYNDVKWIEPGEYEVMRRFGENRWLIILKPEERHQRRVLTLVSSEEAVILPVKKGHYTEH